MPEDVCPVAQGSVVVGWAAGAEDACGWRGKEELDEGLEGGMVVGGANIFVAGGDFEVVGGGPLAIGEVAGVVKPLAEARDDHAAVLSRGGEWKAIAKGVHLLARAGAFEVDDGEVTWVFASLKLRGLLPHAVVEYLVYDGGDGLVSGGFWAVERAGELVWLVLRVVKSEANFGVAAER